MTTIMPEGTRVRNAVKCISDKIQIGDGGDIRSLIREAVNKFDLSPKETDYLYHFYREQLKSDK